MSISFLLLIGLLLFVTNLYLLNNIKKIETNNVKNRMFQINTLVNDNINSLNVNTGDWAIWDDMYNYVLHPNQQFIDSNLDLNSISNLQINLFAIIANDEIREIRMCDYKNRKDIIVNEKILNDLKKYNLLFNVKDNKNNLTSGIITIDNKPMLVSIRAITNSKGSSPKVGMLVMGKFFDDDITEKMQKIVQGDIKIGAAKGVKNLSLDNFDENLVYTSNQSENKIEGSYYLKDLLFDSSYSIKATYNRSIYNEGIHYINFFILFFIVSMLIIFIISIELIKKSIIYPIEKINSEITVIDEINEFNRKIQVAGKGELAHLSKEINLMLARIDRSNRRVNESEKQLKLVIDAANAGFWNWSIRDENLMISSGAMKLLGYSAEDTLVDVKRWRKFIHAEDKMHAINVLSNCTSNPEEIISLELRLRTKDRGYKWFLIQGKTIEADREEAVRMTGIVTDINDKKLSEEELKYLTYYDKLTGLYNRGYYEYILKKLDNNSQLPISVIVADVNGLKFTNDTFSHVMGDKLLKEAGKILKEACGKNAIVSRWGGDEFSVILQNINDREVESICKKIKELCDEREVNSFKVSIALGYSTKRDNSQNINDIIRKAEERMYRNKLLENKSSRNNTISSLSKMLFEKSYETEEHALRMVRLCERIGKKLKLSSAQLDELYLLAKLHDIGKIAISENILNKPGRLTEDEFCIMKTHTHVGYRIASSVPDLRHIAYQILCHHENYDGSGYPNGLKGDAIPLISRLIRIVDSYDVMTSERPYKEAMSSQEAVNELIHCSGRQYDPGLIKLCLEVFEELEYV
ncbi:MAG: diguanylate cyclase [Bacillota bacterium]|nr:diguanylate cyclase [Bacillota bacterium]